MLYCSQFLQLHKQEDVNMKLQVPHRFYLVALGILIACTLLNCNKDENPKPEATASLLLSKLSVAVVPGNTDDVIITAGDQQSQPGTLSFVSDNPGIAQITLNANVLSVKGLQYGSANITISGSNGFQAILPVVVYNINLLETDELYISMTDSFTIRKSYYMYGATGSFFHPVAEDGFFSLGSYGLENLYVTANAINGKHSVITVKARHGSNALAHPVSYNYIGQAIYEPVAPDGYVALGMVVGTETQPPPLTDIVCVRRDLTIAGECASAPLSNLHDQISPTRFVYWKIQPPDAGPHPKAYLTPGTFLMTPLAWNAPVSVPVGKVVMNVLKVNLPLLSESPSQSFLPKLENYDTPPDRTIPLFSRALLLPYTTVKDMEYLSDAAWRIKYSPMYRLEREVYYRRLFHNHNQTSVIQTNTHVTRSGITSEQSESYWNETGIALSVEAGVSIKAFEAKVTATVSQSLGHSSMTSVSEFIETEISKSIDTPPGKAAALWQQYNRYVLYRHNGAELEAVADWEFGLDSYVTDEYP